MVFASLRHFGVRVLLVEDKWLYYFVVSSQIQDDAAYLYDAVMLYALSLKRNPGRWWQYNKRDRHHQSSLGQVIPE